MTKISVQRSSLTAALVILAVAAFLILNIDQLHMHPDEELSYRATQGGLIDVLRWQIDLEDNQAPGWFLIFRIWRTFVGDSEFTSRVLGILLTLPALALIFRIARKGSSGLAAAFAPLVLIGNGLFFQYALDIRMYPLVLLVSAISTYLLWRWLQVGKTRLALLYGASIALMLYTHYLLIFFVGVHVLYFALFSRFRRHLIMQGLGAGLIAALLFSAWLPVALSQINHLRVIEAESGTARGGVGIGVSTLPTTPENIQALIDLATNYLFTIYGVILAAGALLFALPKRTPLARRTYFLALLWTFAVPIVYLLINLVSGVYAPRYVAYLTLGLGLAVGMATAGLGLPRILRWIALLGLVILNVFTFPATLPDRVPYRDYLGQISAASQPGDVVLLVIGGEDDGFARWQYDHYLTPELAANVTTDVDAARDARRVWMITQDWFNDDVQAVFESLEPSHPVQRVIGECSPDHWWCFIAQLMSAPPLQDEAIRFGDTLDFRGADVVTATRQMVSAQVWWTVETPPERDYSFSLQLLNSGGALVANADGAIRDYGVNEVQTSALEPGRIYVDIRDIALPESTPSGDYSLILVAYDPATGARLTLSDGADHYEIGMLTLD